MQKTTQTWREMATNTREAQSVGFEREYIEFVASVEFISRQCFTVVFYRGRIICVD